MANFSSPSECAIDSDGALLDASQITWYYDRDDDNPLPSASSVAPSTGGSSSLPTEVELHPLFRPRLLPPATAKIAGARRSNRTICPSAQAKDPDNVEGLTSTGQKRSQNASPPRRSTTRKIIHLDPVSDDLPGSDDPTQAVVTEPDDDDGDTTTQDQHEQLQAMADADHEVCINSVGMVIALIITCIPAGHQLTHKK